MNAHPSARLTKLIVCVLALLHVAPGASAGNLLRETQKLPDVAAPPGGHAFWIARAMRLNGVPMTIKSFASRSNADEVLHHYERQLRTSSSLKTKRAQEGKWRVLSVAGPSYFITIRARNTARGAEGTIAVSPALAGVSASTRTNFPHPPSMRVVNLQQYDDEGLEAEHISLISTRSVMIEAREFASLLTQHGWQLLRSEGTADRRGGHIIEAQKAAALAFINLQRLQRGGETSIMVVWRKA
jgi:hypothetical protein